MIYVLFFRWYVLCYISETSYNFIMTFIELLTNTFRAFVGRKFSNVLEIKLTPYHERNSDAFATGFNIRLTKKDRNFRISIHD